MGYTITVRVCQTNSTVFFHLAEKAVFTKGSWSEVDEAHVLYLNNSGTSGTLRFLADNGESFIVALGVHTYQRWCDIVTNLAIEQTAVVINPKYYVPGGRATARERQLTTYSVKNAQGKNHTVYYTVTGGDNLWCNITIG